MLVPFRVKLARMRALVSGNTGASRMVTQAACVKLCVYRMYAYARAPRDHRSSL